MLKEIFRTVNVPYKKQGDPGAENTGAFIGFNYGANKPPYVETVSSWTGLAVKVQWAPDPEGKDLYATPYGAGSIYLFATMGTNKWPSWDFGYWRFDIKKGKFIRRMLSSTHFGPLFSGVINTSRNGTPWTRHIYGHMLTQVMLGQTATALIGDEPTSEASAGIGIGEVITLLASHFTALDGTPNTGFSGAWLIDDYDNFFLQGSGVTLTVYNLTTGAFIYDTVMPYHITTICPEDKTRVYILLANNVLLLYDYLWGEVLGAVKVPISKESQGVVMTWDPMFKRLLLIEKLPNNPDGSCASYIRGFRLVPEPVRLTIPIPLKVPRQGRTIPVLVQVKGDMNEGVGGYTARGPQIVNSSPTGGIDVRISPPAALVGIPTTNFKGDFFAQVALPPPGGYDGYDGYDYSAAVINFGDVTVDVELTTYGPDQEDIPISGTGVGAPGTVSGGGTPGAPGGGESPGETPGGGDLSETAPNMTYILNQVYAQNAPNGQPWDLREHNSQAANGRGMFTEVAVRAMHDVDARFGHVRKDPGQNQYNGHSVDAVNFKNDDGVTAEIIDIVAGTESPGSENIMWGWDDRSANNLDRWKFP